MVAQVRKYQGKILAALFCAVAITLASCASQKDSVRLVDDPDDSPRAQVKRTPSVWLMTRTITAVQPCLGITRRNGKSPRMQMPWGPRHQAIPDISRAMRGTNRNPGKRAGNLQATGRR